MNRIQTSGIVLKRTNYGEADRIVTVLTPDYGKLRLMARGVRKPKAKLAGGIELFSVSDMTFVRGRGEIGTLISTRLRTHYGRIVQDIRRVQLGYDLLKILDKATEDETEEGYFDLLEQTLKALDDKDIDQELIQAWFSSHMLRLAGHSPNLETTAAGTKLGEDQTYAFDFDTMSFEPEAKGRFGPGDVKALRLLFSGYTPSRIMKIEGVESHLAHVIPLLRTLSSM